MSRTIFRAVKNVGYLLAGRPELIGESPSVVAEANTIPSVVSVLAEQEQEYGYVLAVVKDLRRYIPTPISTRVPEETDEFKKVIISPLSSLHAYSSPELLTKKQALDALFEISQRGYVTILPRRDENRLVIGRDERIVALRVSGVTNTFRIDPKAVALAISEKDLADQLAKLKSDDAASLKEAGILATPATIVPPLSQTLQEAIDRALRSRIKTRYGTSWTVGYGDSPINLDSKTKVSLNLHSNSAPHHEVIASRIEELARTLTPMEGHDFYVVHKTKVVEELPQHEVEAALRSRREQFVDETLPAIREATSRVQAARRRLFGGTQPV